MRRARGDGQSPNRAAFDLGGEQDGGPDDHRYVAAEQGGDGLRVPAIGDVSDLDAGHRIEQFAGEMMRAAETDRPEAQ